MDRKLDELLFALTQNMTIAVSGEKLARDLGVSHSTLVRWIEKLREAKVEIRGELFTGYRLTRLPDIILPQVLRPRLRTRAFGKSFFHFYSVDSTNAFALRMLSHDRAIHDGATINLYHLGFVKRDFSYIDDIVAGTLAILDSPAAEPGHRLYNLGAARSEDILHVIELFEAAIGKKAKIELKPGEPGDLQETAADIADTLRDFAWTPKVAVEEGIPKFVEWFKSYNHL